MVRGADHPSAHRLLMIAVKVRLRKFNNTINKMTKYNASLLKTKKVRCGVAHVKKSLEEERLGTES